MSLEIGLNTFIDKYNPTKKWLIKKTKCNHFYLNQENKGIKLNKGFVRVKKGFILDILN